VWRQAESGAGKSENQGCFFKAEARKAGKQLALIAIAEVAEEVGFPLAVGEELGVELVGIEARHGSAIEAEGAGGEDEIRALERTVAKSGFFGELLIADEVLAHVRVRKESWQVLVEFRVPGNDDGDGGGHGFVDVAGSERGLEARFGFGGGDENEAGGRGVGAGGAEAGELVSLAQELGGYGDGEPRGVGARFAEELVEGGVGDRLAGRGGGGRLGQGRHVVSLLLSGIQKKSEQAEGPVRLSG
jgi:hypothetical protein